MNPSAFKIPYAASICLHGGVGASLDKRPSRKHAGDPTASRRNTSANVALEVTCVEGLCDLGD